MRIKKRLLATFKAKLRIAELKGWTKAIEPLKLRIEELERETQCPAN